MSHENGIMGIFTGLGMGRDRIISGKLLIQSLRTVIISTRCGIGILLNGPSGLRCALSGIERVLWSLRRRSDKWKKTIPAGLRWAIDGPKCLSWVFSTIRTFSRACLILFNKIDPLFTNWAFHSGLIGPPQSWRSALCMRPVMDPYWTKSPEPISKKRLLDLLHFVSLGSFTKILWQIR